MAQREISCGSYHLTRADNNGNKCIDVEIGRKLTSGETNLAKEMFGNSIDYTKVHIYDKKWAFFQGKRVAMTPDGNIYFAPDVYTKDFSLASASTKHFFIHEMTHVWQYQMGAANGWLGIKQLCNGGYTSEVNSVDSGKNELKAYDTDLTGRDINKKFQDFNFEQQGRIIEFWFDAIYLQKISPSREHHQKSLKLLGYVERILRDFLLNPKDKSLLPKA